ncbi:hypothetical protein PPYR_04642 [Photinus pyralis]|uniref:Protein krueppel n=1 Tax=Photinus pyralis TaxID=7054 RepID=A0A1Y1KPL8_PHOPY|nr:zinc finger protein 11-like [Photinus pyralis]KAB0802456.1 hypothetical protein PPYR_04642 [Photinus pyralis]
MSAFNSILFINISRVCRICLTESASMRSIFSTLEENEALEESGCNFWDILKKITSVPISVSEGFPTLLCSNCVLLILGAYKFQIQFQHSNSILQQYLTACHVKQEVHTDSVFDYVPNTAELTYETNVTENYIDAITKTQNEQYGKRQTSKQQIHKRTNSRVCKKRGRKPKTEFGEGEDEKSSSDHSLHPCPICTKEFSALDLRQHAHTHKALRKYLNIPAKYRILPTVQFYRKFNPNNVTVGLHSLKDKVHKCVACQFQCNASQLRIHLQLHRNQTEFKCDQCQRVFKKLNHLNTHRVKHLKECPFKCEQCGKGFVIQKNYECHMLTHNTNQELPHECSFCLKRFSNPEHLNRHKIMHTENVTYSVKYKVCKCNHCLKSFRDRASLQEHMCVPVEQSANIRYPCKVCSKVFKHSSGLYNHNRNIHKLKGAKVLCSVCGNYVSNIYNHMMRHNGEKPFQCNQCNKRFVGKPQLRQHLLVHSGLKPFVCSVCAKAFNNLYNLQVHERIHKGDRCHICNICSKGFLEKSYLKKHMNVHTKI